MFGELRISESWRAPLQTTCPFIGDALPGQDRPEQEEMH